MSEPLGRSHSLRPFPYSSGLIPGLALTSIGLSLDPQVLLTLDVVFPPCVAIKEFQMLTMLNQLVFHSELHLFSVDLMLFR